MFGGSKTNLDALDDLKRNGQVYVQELENEVLIQQPGKREREVSVE
jgi:hypothetical protein